jgi:stage II sporulation protein D
MAGCLMAAEYRDGRLLLEINLVSESELRISLPKAASAVHVSEMDGLFNTSLVGDFSISIVNPESMSYFGVLNYKEMGEAKVADEQALPREYFAWENGNLAIKQELLYFFPDSYSNREQAEAFADEKGLPHSKIMEVQMINSTVRITGSRGEESYLETPIKISSVSDIKINSSSLGYAGEFVIKTVNRKLVINHLLPLEDYISGVVQNEIGNSSPTEALKAQAVAARTHALSLLLNNRHKVDGYDLCSGTHCQVYKGKHLQNDAIREAVAATSYEVLFAGNYPADTPYHSSCGGKTDASSQIWKGKPVDHLNGVTCIPEADEYDLSQEADARAWIDTKHDTAGMSSWERGALVWEKSISKAKLAENTGLEYVNSITITKRGRSGRILNMIIAGNKVISLDNEYKIRQAFGSLSSSFFYLKASYKDGEDGIIVTPGNSITVKGKGAGHGIGMCQIGALRMARLGVSYIDILQHYYPGTTLNSTWMRDAQPLFYQETYDE